MSSFTPAIEKDFTFDGDTIHVKMSRLKRKHMLKVMGYMPADGNATGMSPEKSLEMLDAASEFLPNLIIDFKGCKDEDGNAVDFETALNEVYFMPLIAEILSTLFEESSVNEKKRAISH